MSARSRVFSSLVLYVGVPVLNCLDMSSTATEAPSYDMHCDEDRGSSMTDVVWLDLHHLQSQRLAGFNFLRW